MPRHYKDVPQNEKIFIVMASVVLLFLAFGCEGTSPSVSIPAKYVGDYTGTWECDELSNPVTNEEKGGWTMIVLDTGAASIYFTLGDGTPSSIIPGGVNSTGVFAASDGETVMTGSVADNGSISGTWIYNAGTDTDSGIFSGTKD